MPSDIPGRCRGFGAFRTSAGSMISGLFPSGIPSAAHRMQRRLRDMGRLAATPTGSIGRFFPVAACYVRWGGPSLLLCGGGPNALIVLVVGRVRMPVISPWSWTVSETRRRCMSSRDPLRAEWVHRLQ